MRKTFFSKNYIATPRPVADFRLGSEVCMGSKETFKVVSTFLGSILEVVGTCRGERFNFGGDAIFMMVERILSEKQEMIKKRFFFQKFL